MKPIEVAAGIEIIDLAVYLKRENMLVIGDVHLGYEGALASRGVLLPRFQLNDATERLERIFSALEAGKLEAVVVNGDLKHEFARISEQEWREVLKFLDFLLAHSSQVIIVKGNHDVKLLPIARKRGIVVSESIDINGTFICHGDSIPGSADFKKARTVIVGNEHPAVSIREGARVELYKCFISGKWQGKKMLVMPSFSQVSVGTDILKGQFISPFMGQDLSSFGLFVVGSETYYFGKVRNLQ